MCVGFRCVIMGLSWFEPRSNAFFFFFFPPKIWSTAKLRRGVCQFHLTLNHGISPIQKYGELLGSYARKR